LHYNTVMSRPRVLLLADRSRDGVPEVLSELRAALDTRAEIVDELPVDDTPLPAQHNATIAVAIGGDGTLISQARRVVEHNLPLVGVNVGRLGFLAEFDVPGLIQHADVIFSDDPPVYEHMILSMEICDTDGQSISTFRAINDGVITAGEPHRMIELSLTIDGQDGPLLNGDGVIVATPVGTTAYNVSAGGPIVHPLVQALTITPLAAHSLAFRPIVVSADSEVRATLHRVNAGTALVTDGQTSAPLHEGQSVVFKRNGRKVKLVINPATSYWRILLDKLRWAAPPTYRDRGA
jgi:NAD+ kinase